MKWVTVEVTEQHPSMFDDCKAGNGKYGHEYARYVI